MSETMITIATFTEAPPKSYSGAAFRLNFVKGNLRRAVYVPISRSKFENNSLAVQEWLLTKDLGFVIKNGYSLKDGKLVIVPPSNVSIVPRTNSPAVTLQESTGLPINLESYTSPEPAAIKKGFFTIVMPDGGWRTFRIKTSSKSKKTVIGALIGNNNISDYKWFAYVVGTKLRFFGSNHFNKIEMQEHFDTILGNPDEAGKTFALESKQCCRCGAELTTPESINNPRGLGPICDKMPHAFL